MANKQKVVLKKQTPKKEMTSKEKKAAIILIIIGWITIALGGLIQYRDYKEAQDSNLPEDEETMKIDVNDKLKKEKCHKNLCLRDLEISGENDEIFYMTGILKNNSSSPLNDAFINILINHNKKTSKEWYYIESLDSNQELNIEMAVANNELLEATSFKIEFASDKEIEEYRNYLDAE